MTFEEEMSKINARANAKYKRDREQYAQEITSTEQLAQFLKALREYMEWCIPMDLPITETAWDECTHFPSRTCVRRLPQLRQTIAYLECGEIELDHDLAFDFWRLAINARKVWWRLAA